MAAVEIKNLSYRYQGAETVLAGIDLQLADGEAHAILGGSGAGKTTLLNLLAGLLRPESGTIGFNGRDVTHLRGAERNVAQVFQFPVLYPSLNVAENIGFALGNRGWRKQAIATRVRDLAELLELAPLLRKRPDALSLFEKQLVAIGRALARPDVAVVLLDEPLTAVAPATKWRLRRALKTVQQELALTMVYVTHDQAEALTFAERITMLHRGSIVQTGTPAELYEAPAHTLVAEFIGSPGMNLVAATASGGRLRIGGRVVAATAIADGPCLVGFRPEWARVEPQSTAADDGLPVRVVATRALGTEAGAPVGLVTVRLGGTTLRVRQRLDWLAGQTPIGAAPGEWLGPAPPELSASAEPARLRLDAERLVAFRDGNLVSRHAANAG